MEIFCFHAGCNTNTTKAEITFGENKFDKHAVQIYLGNVGFVHST